MPALLCSLRVTQKRYAEAGPLLRKALAGYDRIHGCDDPRNLLVLKCMMKSLILGGKLDEAEDVLLRILKGDEMYGFGVDIGVLEFLGLIYKNQGKFTLAADYLRRCVEKLTESVGSGHIVTLAVLRHLAEVYVSLSRHEEAEALLRQGLGL